MPRVEVKRRLDQSSLNVLPIYVVLDIAFLGKYYIKPEGGVPYLNSHLCPIPLLAEV